jgi:hypothetical protein
MAVFAPAANPLFLVSFVIVTGNEYFPRSGDRFELLSAINTAVGFKL